MLGKQWFNFMKGVFMICKKLLTVVAFLFVGSNFCVGSNSIQSLSNLDAECKGQNVSMSKNEYFENISDKGTDLNSDKSNSPEMTNKTIEVVQPEALSEAEQAYKELAKSYPIQLIDWTSKTAVKKRKEVVRKELLATNSEPIASRIANAICCFEKLYQHFVDPSVWFDVSREDYCSAFDAILGSSSRNDNPVWFRVKTHTSFVIKQFAEWESIVSRNDDDLDDPTLLKYAYVINDALPSFIGKNIRQFGNDLDGERLFAILLKDLLYFSVDIQRKALDNDPFYERVSALIGSLSSN